MHGECPVGGVKVTGYNTPAGRYCAITGGTYTVIGTTNTGQEAGNCTLPSGKVCDADDYYNGTCTSSSPQPAAPTATPAPIGKPNPASQYCASVGGTLKIEQRGDGAQYGVCYFADNKQCEEWALERGDCPVGGVKVTGYNTPAARATARSREAGIRRPARRPMARRLGPASCRPAKCAMPGRTTTGTAAHPDRVAAAGG